MFSKHVFVRLILAGGLASPTLAHAQYDPLNAPPTPRAAQTVQDSRAEIEANRRDAAEKLDRAKNGQASAEDLRARRAAEEMTVFETAEDRRNRLADERRRASAQKAVSCRTVDKGVPEYLLENRRQQLATMEETYARLSASGAQTVADTVRQGIERVKAEPLVGEKVEECFEVSATPSKAPPKKEPKLDEAQDGKDSQDKDDKKDRDPDPDDLKKDIYDARRKLDDLMRQRDEMPADKDKTAINKEIRQLQARINTWEMVLSHTSDGARDAYEDRSARRNDPLNKGPDDIRERFVPGMDEGRSPTRQTSPAPQEYTGPSDRPLTSPHMPELTHLDGPKPPAPVNLSVPPKP